ncbi:MAG TPA: hypothetical protein V6C65_22225 [Allocoleopsis sp.]
MEFAASLFGAGLGFGLLIALLGWLSHLRVKSSLRQEIGDLQKHLNTQMNITAKGYEELQREVAQLKKENENLRITVATLSNKPGRAEIKTLHIWDKAVKLMTLKSPVFAPAWELAVLEAKKEIDETETGVKALVRKVFPILSPEYNRSTIDSQPLDS